jgi:hypothetical protein
MRLEYSEQKQAWIATDVTEIEVIAGLKLLAIKLHDVHIGKNSMIATIDLGLTQAPIKRTTDKIYTIEIGA